jgi:hypothetical protein
MKYAKIGWQELEVHMWGAANIFRGQTAGRDRIAHSRN